MASIGAIFVLLFTIGVMSLSNSGGIAAFLGDREPEFNGVGLQGSCTGPGCLASNHERPERDTTQNREAYITEEDAAIVHNPSIAVNPLTELTAPVARDCCNQSSVQSMLAAVVTRMNALHARDEEEMKREVLDLQATIQDITGMLQKLRGGIAPVQTTAAPPPVDCSDVLASGQTRSAVYTVQPRDGGEIDVYCDMVTDGGGWTVFQRRKDGSVEFYRDFHNYSRGFGDLEGEFWLGNDNLHRLTIQDEYTLRVDIADFDNNTAYAYYDSFSVGDWSDYYRLEVEGYSGTAGDSMSPHNGQRFSTKDVDNDGWFQSCAEQFGGAWWYGACYKSHLNGRYNGPVYQGVAWFKWKENFDSLKATEMKIRRRF